MRIVTLALVLALSGFTSAEPLAEKYLLEGRLADGEKTLNEHLQQKPEDDEVRFGLGVVQFLRAFENLGTSLHSYGLRTERAFRGIPQEMRSLLSQNENPKRISYSDCRQLLETFVMDLERAEATLAKIDDETVTLSLHVGLIKIDLFGQGTPINAAFVLGRTQAGIPQESVATFVIGFDRGDVNWLRGYCHFLCAGGEVLLAVDGQEIFDCTAHLFFEKVASPHSFLQEEPRSFDSLIRWNRAMISDILAFIHLWRFPIKESARMKQALGHLEAMLDQAKEMWMHYLKETDDNNEWIPNPRQTGVLQVKVSQEMVDTWLKTVEEAELVLEGKKLIPFWRGTDPKRGVNVRRVFTKPRTINPFLWFQGTAATPYLEEGPLTELANPRMIRRLNETFGGVNFFGFAFWFN